MRFATSNLLIAAIVSPPPASENADERAIAAASARESAHFAELMGGQANAAALADFNKGR